MGWEVFPAGMTELLLRLQADYPPAASLCHGERRGLPGSPRGRTRRRRGSHPLPAVAHCRDGRCARGRSRRARLLRLEPARQLRVGRRLQQALRARLRRLRHAATDTERQRALVSAALCGRAGASRTVAARRAAMGSGHEGREQRWKLVWSDEFDGDADRRDEVGLRTRQRVLRLQEPPVGARLGQRGTAVLHARAGERLRPGRLAVHPRAEGTAARLRLHVGAHQDAQARRHAAVRQALRQVRVPRQGAARQGAVARDMAAAAGRQVRRMGGLRRDRRHGDRRREARTSTSARSISGRPSRSANSSRTCTSFPPGSRWRISMSMPWSGSRARSAGRWTARPGRRRRSGGAAASCAAARGSSRAAART